MKLLYTLALLTVIAACESKQKPKANFHLPFRQDSLIGNWMIITVTTDEAHSDEDSSLQKVIDSIRLTAFRFEPNGTLITDVATPAFAHDNWQFDNKNKQLLTRHKDSTAPSGHLLVVRYRNDSLTLDNALPVTVNDLAMHKKRAFHMRYIYKRLRTSDSVPDLFAPALNKWRQKPLQAEDDAAIKERMKQVLYYYSAYFANIRGNQIPVFSTQKILCPIKFYSGGIGMKKFKAEDEWTNIFYNKEDARKARTFVDDAFTNINGYPDKGGDYVAEYIEALKIVADLL